MATSRLFFLFFSLFIFLDISTGEVIISCPALCPGNGPMVRFPFRLTQQSNNRCGYPGFELSCNYRGQTILRLNNSGEFTVQSIDYVSQIIEINDPDHCLPRRFLNRSFSLVGSPFDEQSLSKFTFLNCSDTVITDTGLRKVTCLSGTNFTVVAIPTDRYRELLPQLKPSCSEISTAWIPPSLAEGVKLKWYVPDCGFKNDKKMDMKIGCSNDPEGSNGLPRSLKYGIIISIGIPGFLCFVGLGCYLCGKVNNRLQRHYSGTDFATSIMPQPDSILNGLDRPTIESYPKTLIGESGRLPKANDNACTICLSEYQPKETLRTIPECNHYFHANCIDEWLKINATCPLCRKSQASSSVLTPSTSTSSSSSSLMSVP